jgi:hypothetical protein
MGWISERTDVLNWAQWKHCYSARCEELLVSCSNASQTCVIWWDVFRITRPLQHTLDCTFGRGSCQMRRCCPSCCSFQTHPPLHHGHPPRRPPPWMLPRTEPRTGGETTRCHSLPTEFPPPRRLPCCHRHEALRRALVRYPCCPPSWDDGVAVLVAATATTKRMRSQDSRRRPRPRCPGSDEGGGELKKTLPLPPPTHKKQAQLHERWPWPDQSLLHVP